MPKGQGGFKYGRREKEYHNFAENVRSKATRGKSRLHETMWYMHRRMVTGTMILSILLLYALAITVYSSLSNAKMFSFGWSNRIVENPGTDDAVALYRDNTDTSNTKLDLMLKKALDAATCRPVFFSGGLQWEDNQVSPTCNCIRNTHIEYVKAVTPYGIRMTAAAMDTDQSKRNRIWIGNRLETECFQNLRHTQVEDISDPYTNDGETSFTNIVAVAVFWNVISCTTAAFVYYFDVLSLDKRPVTVEDAQLQNRKVEEGKSVAAPSLGGAEGSRSMMSQAAADTYFFVLSFLGLLWPIISLAFFCGAGQSAALILVSVSFYVITMVMHGMQGTKQDMQEGYDMYPTRKKIVFWLGYTLTTPAVLMACNMLMQRRDVMYNFTTVFMVVVVGLCSMASEMIYTGYEHFYIQMHTKKDADQLKLANDFDENIANYKEQKNAMVKMNIVVTLIILVGIGCTTFPIFSSTPFSNAYAAMYVTLPILLIIPPLVTGRIIGLVPNEVDARNSSGAAGQTWVLELTNIEFVARAFFTVAVIYDLASLGTADNAALGVAVAASNAALS